jgi:hypothetical protein
VGLPACATTAEWIALAWAGKASLQELVTNDINHRQMDVVCNHFPIKAATK